MLPHLAGVVIETVRRDGVVVVIGARARPGLGECPRCGSGSTRVHGRYLRRLADAAIAAHQVVIELRVRRFFCDNSACAARTFAEQIPGLTTRYARRTVLLRGMLEAIGLALAGRVGARLARRLGLPASRDTLLRLVRALPDPPTGDGAITSLGVDDFALRRGHVYATILVNHETGRPVDVLPDRDGDTLASWLMAHPTVQVITRDRAGTYADGCTRGAPQARQCADRWHLWKNLGEAVEKTVIAHRGCLADPADDPGPTTSAPPGEPPSAAAVHECHVANADVSDREATVETPAGDEGRLAVRSRERYAQVHALHAEGKGMRTIGKELSLDRKTVRRFLEADSPEQILVKTASRDRVLDDHQAYLHRRWNEGCTNTTQLFAEIHALGYRGSIRTVYRYLQAFRDGEKAPDPKPPSPLKVRHVVGWIMRDPNNLDTEDAQRLQAVLDRCPELAALRRHVGAFAHMIRDLRGDRLPEWIDRAHADSLPALHSFITGLYHDIDAVTGGLTLEPSNGRTEGTVNKIKALKRAMYGRANLDLLRKRILLA